MPKSIAIPTNSGANAMEIGLKGPIAQTAKAAQPTRPVMSVASTAQTARNDLNPRASQKQSRPTDSAVENPAPSDNVENWSSERATGPVTRTRTPRAATRPSAFAASFTATTALRPGSTEL